MAQAHPPKQRTVHETKDSLHAILTLETPRRKNKQGDCKVAPREAHVQKRFAPCLAGARSRDPSHGKEDQGNPAKGPATVHARCMAARHGTPNQTNPFCLPLYPVIRVDVPDALPTGWGKNFLRKMNFANNINKSVLQRGNKGAMLPAQTQKLLSTTRAADLARCENPILASMKKHQTRVGGGGGGLCERAGSIPLETRTESSGHPAHLAALEVPLSSTTSSLLLRMRLKARISRSSLEDAWRCACSTQVSPADSFASQAQPVFLTGCVGCPRTSSTLLPKKAHAQSLLHGCAAEQNPTRSALYRAEAKR